MCNKRLEEKVHWEIDIGDCLVRVPVQFLSEEGRPIVVVGEWECSARKGDEVRKEAPEKLSLAATMLQEHWQEVYGVRSNMGEKLPEIIEYYEQLKSTFRKEEYPISKVDPTWSEAKVPRFEWEVSSYSRGWVSVKKELLTY